MFDFQNIRDIILLIHVMLTQDQGTVLILNQRQTTITFLAEKVLFLKELLCSLPRLRRKPKAEMKSQPPNKEKQ